MANVNYSKYFRIMVTEPQVKISRIRWACTLYSVLISEGNENV